MPVAGRQQVVDAPQRDRGGGDADERRRERREARRRERLISVVDSYGGVGARASLRSWRDRDVVRHAAGIHVSRCTELRRIRELCSQAGHGAPLRGILPRQLLELEETHGDDQEAQAQQRSARSVRLWPKQHAASHASGAGRSPARPRDFELGGCRVTGRGRRV